MKEMMDSVETEGGHQAQAAAGGHKPAGLCGHRAGPPVQKTQEAVTDSVPRTFHASAATHAHTQLCFHPLWTFALQKLFLFLFLKVSVEIPKEETRFCT